MIANTILFRTLGDPRRLRIIEVLAAGPRNVGEISAHLGIAQSGVSRHLRILADSGFVRSQPRGQERVYALRPEAFTALGDWADSYRTLWSQRLDRLDAVLQQDAETRKGPQI